MSENTTLENKVTADREPSTLHENFREWIEETTGYEADLKTVQLAASLRIKFQKSEKNQEDLAERKAAAEAKIGTRAEQAEQRAIKAAERAEAKKVSDAAKLAKKESDAVAKAEKTAADKDAKDAKEAAEAGMDIDPMDPEAPMIETPPAKPVRRRAAPAKAAAKPAAKKPVAKKATAAKSTTAPAAE